MTVSSATARVSYSGNGATTAFTVPFYFLASSHLRVVLRSSAGVEDEQVLTTDYSVTGAGEASGGTVTMVTAPASGETLVITRAVPVTQETNLLPNDPLPAESLEQALDKLTMIVAQQQETLDRALVFPITDAAASIDELPVSDDRASKYLAFGSDGKPVVTAGTTSNPIISSFAETLLDDASAAAMRTTLGLGTAAVKATGTASGDVPLVGTASATEALAGIAELATQTETDAGTDDARIVTALKALIATSRWRPAGECRLTKVSTNLQLDRFNGSRLFINGTNVQIPSAGVTLAPTSLSVDTTYYIYAYMSGSTLTLEASTTAPATDSTYGHQIKNGDATRTLVGMARTITGPAWVDTDAQRYVLSYFNRRGIVGKSALTANRTSTSATYAEINSEIRVEFITWADEVVVASADGPILHSATGSTVDTSIGFDGTTAEETMSRFQAYTNSAQGGFGLCLPKTGLAVGYHYATLLGRTSGATATWTDAGGAGERCSLKIMVRG